MDDQELDRAQRIGITNIIKNLQTREASGRLTRQQEQIAGYFPMLAKTHASIEEREDPLQKLAFLLNRYFGRSKIASYDQTKYEFLIKADEVVVPLSGLSSGEKQIVSLFSTLVLNKDDDIFVIIDEPELSLSVLWQENLLEDIISIKGVSNILSVTHSPFIYGEKLAKYTKDLTDYTTKYAEQDRG